MAPSQIRRVWLEDFWFSLGGNKNTGYRLPQRKKMKALIKMAEVTIEPTSRSKRENLRAIFNCVKLSRHSLKSHPKCFVCFKDADVRHHIIPLKNGGINSKRNLVSLCNGCHAKIHPWLESI